MAGTFPDNESAAKKLPGDEFRQYCEIDVAVWKDVLCRFEAVVIQFQETHEFYGWPPFC